MFCIKCGENLPDEAEFCFKCGENLTKAKNTIEQPDNHQNQEPIIQLNNYQNQEQFIQQNTYQNQQQVVQPNNNQGQQNYQNQIAQSSNYQNYSNPIPSNEDIGRNILKIIGIFTSILIIVAIICISAFTFDEKIMIETAKDSFYEEFAITNFETMVDYTFDNTEWSITNNNYIYFSGTHKGSKEDYNFTFKFDEDVGLASYFNDAVYTGDVIDLNIGYYNYKHEISYIMYWLFDIAEGKKDLPTEKFDISMLIEAETVEDNPYEWLLDQIREVANDRSFDHESLGLPYYLSFSDDNLSKMGYDYVDVNDDGIPELFIGGENTRGNFISCYTIVNDEIYPLVETGERYGYSLTNDMYFAYWGSNGMSGEDYSLLKLEKNANILSYIEYRTWTLSDMWDFDSPYYDYYVPIENGQPNFNKKRLYQNTELEYFESRFIDEYQFNFTPF